MGPLTKRLNKLSGRERQVAGLILDRLTYKQIADQLKISPATVAQYARRIFQRLAVRDRIVLEAMWDVEVAPEQSIGRRAPDLSRAAGTRKYR